MQIRQLNGVIFSIAHLNALPHSSLDTSLIDNGSSSTIRKATKEYTETAHPSPN